MNPGYFVSHVDSHAHSRRTLDLLHEYNDFMESIDTLVDMGCGSGLDLEWWATQTTNEDQPRPLNIKCFGVDTDTRREIPRYSNINYLIQDFESPIALPQNKKIDVLWCHDAWQYVLNPFQTLRQWYDAMNKDAMLIIVVPQTTNISRNQQDFTQQSGVYWHWSIVNLMHVLAVSGFDTGAGFWFKDVADPWIHAVVYRGDQGVLDPRSTSWYNLAERGVLPESATACIKKFGYLKQSELCLPWLDRMMYSWSRH